MNLISFIILSGGSSSRMGQDKGLTKIKINGRKAKPLIGFVLNNVYKFLDYLNLKSQIDVKVVLHDYIQQEEYLEELPSLTENDIILDEQVWRNVYSDIKLPSKGSLLGLWSAMTELRRDVRNIFVLPCDKPLISIEVLSYIFNIYFQNELVSKVFAKKRIKNLKMFQNVKPQSGNIDKKKRSELSLDLQKKKYLKKDKIKYPIYTSYVPRWQNQNYEPFFAIYHINSILPIIEERIFKDHYNFQKIFAEIQEDPYIDTKTGRHYYVNLKIINIEEELKQYDPELYTFIDVNSPEKLEEIEKIINKNPEKFL
ncbi:MAG: NTP transferase domain-containing protein [Promethearchaeota archaeon]